MPRGAGPWAEGKTPNVLNADVRATSSVVHVILGLIFPVPFLPNFFGLVLESDSAHFKYHLHLGQRTIYVTGPWT